MSPAGGPGPLDVHVSRKRLVNASGQAIEVISDLAFRLGGGRDRRADRPVRLRQVDRAADHRRPRPTIRGRSRAPCRSARRWRSRSRGFCRGAASGQHTPRRAADRRTRAGGADRPRSALPLIAKHFPGELSLGLARRVALARASPLSPRSCYSTNRSSRSTRRSLWRCRTISRRKSQSGRSRPFS